jgi:membrane protein YdbS with pleckstrin-like domain
VALAVILLMTPAALHRLGFQGEDDPEFFNIGSRLVIAASIPLAIGISADVAVVFFKTTENTITALSAGAIALVALLAFWLVYPIWHRARFSG